MFSVWLIYCSFLFKESGTSQLCGKDKRWQAFGNSCYLFGKWHRLNWKAARSRCSKMDAELVSLTTKDEINFIYNRTKNSNRFFWIGLRYRTVQRNWTWSNGDEVNITKWGRKEPNNLSREHCGEIIRKSKYWNNKQCKEKRAWICEKAKTFSISNPIHKNVTTSGR